MYVLAPNQTVEIFPYSIGALRRDNPATSFPKEMPASLLASFGVYEVTPTEAPTFDALTHKLSQSVAQVNGAWLQTWEVHQLDFADAADNVRAQRNSLLSGSDWTQLTDAPVDATSWASYRQDLRDITAQAGFPWDVKWPLEPQ